MSSSRCLPARRDRKCATRADGHDNLFCGDVITQDDGEEFCRDGMFAGVHEKWASLTWTVVRIALWVGVAGWLHWRRWYWTV